MYVCIYILYILIYLYIKLNLISAQRQEIKLNREVDRTIHDKEVQVKQTLKAEQKAKDNFEVANEKKRTVENLETELEEYKKEVQNLRKAIYQLEKDRERLGNEVSEQRR